MVLVVALPYHHHQGECRVGRRLHGRLATLGSPAGVVDNLAYLVAGEPERVQGVGIVARLVDIPVAYVEVVALLELVHVAAPQHGHGVLHVDHAAHEQGQHHEAARRTAPQRAGAAHPPQLLEHDGNARHQHNDGIGMHTGGRGKIGAQKLPALAWRGFAQDDGQRGREHGVEIVVDEAAHEQVGQQQHVERGLEAAAAHCMHGHREHDGHSHSHAHKGEGALGVVVAQLKDSLENERVDFIPRGRGQQVASRQEKRQLAPHGAPYGRHRPQQYALETVHRYWVTFLGDGK